MPDSKPLDRKRLGRYSRQKGIRFERRIATLFRKAGFGANRILEYDGFAAGCDLALWKVSGDGKCTLLPVALQCKNTATPERSAEQGLEESKRGMPSAEVWACIYNENRVVKALWSESSLPDYRTWSTFSVLLARLQQKYHA